MEFVGTFWALVPPIVAIVLALITKETYSSLFVGILVGALLLAQFNPVDSKADVRKVKIKVKTLNEIYLYNGK